MDDDGWHKLIGAQELLRVIGATLYRFGLSNAAATLESEANIEINSITAQQLRGLILQGDWQGSLQTLSGIEMAESERLAVSYVILKRKYVELLSQDGLFSEIVASEIVASLRQIQELGVGIEEIRLLARLLLYKIWGRQSNIPSREELLVEVEKLLPPGVFVENRLVELVEQALLSQKESCIYHNSAPQRMTLFRDHACVNDKLPCKIMQIARDHNAGILRLQFSRNGKFLASCDGDVAIIWEVFDGHLVRRRQLNGRDMSIACLCWSPDDSEVLTCGYDGVSRWDAATGQFLAMFSKNGVGMLSCAWEDGNIVTGNMDGSMSMWTAEGAETANWSNYRDTTKFELGIISANKEIVYVSDISTISLFNWETGEEKTVAETTIVVSFALSLDHKHLVVALDENWISLWNIESRTPKHIKLFNDDEVLDFHYGVCFGGFDEAFIASANRDSRVRIWHKSSGELVVTLEGHEGAVNCVCWNPTIPTMLVSGGGNGHIRVWGTYDD